MGWRARCPRIGDAWAPTKSNTGRKYDNKQGRDNFSTAKTSLPDDSVRCGRHRFGGLTEQANARSMATLGVVPAAIFPGAVPKAFAAEKVIRLRKAGRLAIMALLNNVPRHSCQIETPLSWHRGGRNL